MNPDDPRARRTRARLRAAALDLSVEGGGAPLSTAAIARRAGVNRATVYAHYKDADALLTDAMEEALAPVVRAASLCPLDSPAHRAPEPLVELFEHVRANAGLYGRMLGAHGSPGCAAALRTRLTEELSARFTEGARPEGSDGIPVELHASFLAGALIGVIAQGTADDGAPWPPDEAADAVWHLIRPRPPE
ncbi:TetR/AcrR family transcriptional regulator [Nocardiopsis suaedae]|uniref:TetR/AcrR family transcriptional regulator n=1 Tax=Nocardiopsis suaedae TaxID=3018444 RepID=A0ABT4TF30_9ACTN|nr:TetR/AcrR family transcriptional regulator [Nocardiopsis suaedae]MDA2803320.1 TetR/AcrR family transcriptional regulator [Nocardiopsis suaedae]